MVPTAREREALFFAPDPVGTGPAIALRFVRALQAGHDWAAAHELGLFGRAYFANHSVLVLHRVLREVAEHAGVRGAAACTRAIRVNREAAAVHCGQLVVVVHVRATTVGSGVLLSADHPRHDVVRGPHTHAYTRFVLL